MNPDPIFLPGNLRLLRGLPLPRKLGLLEKLYGKELSTHGIATVSCANGHVWTLDLREVTHRWLVYENYEGSRQMDWLRSWLRRGGVFIDSGANIGQYIVSLSHLPGVETVPSSLLVKSGIVSRAASFATASGQFRLFHWPKEPISRKSKSALPAGNRPSARTGTEINSLMKSSLQ